MPIYDYFCAGCKQSETVFRKSPTSSETDIVVCYTCGALKRRTLSLGTAITFKPGYFESLDCVVESKKEYRNILKERGLVEL